MTAEGTDPDEEWPLPPSWMWSCTECTQSYKAMKWAPVAVEAAMREAGPGVDCDPMDSVVSTQIRLAQHIAAHHAADIPAADPECDQCVHNSTARHIPERLVMEHRARHLFAPPAIVGLF